MSDQYQPTTPPQYPQYQPGGYSPQPVYDPSYIPGMISQPPSEVQEGYEPTTEKERDEFWDKRAPMAWLALVSMVGSMIALFFIKDVSKIEQLGIALSWFYLAMASIVGAFMGFKTWASIRGR